MLLCFVLAGWRWVSTGSGNAYFERFKAERLASIRMVALVHPFTGFPCFKLTGKGVLFADGGRIVYVQKDDQASYVVDQYAPIGVPSHYVFSPGEGIPDVADVADVFGIEEHIGADGLPAAQEYFGHKVVLTRRSACPPGGAVFANHAAIGVTDD